ncbi:MAG: diguanylate cyclase [Lachnospiraceae bacterium]|nr:diguanylate cyclase [Lachnospiraceae bacterium]
MVNMMYSVLSLFCALGLIVILNQNMAVATNTRWVNAFTKLLILAVTSCLIDTLWGLSVVYITENGLTLQFLNFALYSMRVMVSYAFMRYAESSAGLTRSRGEKIGYAIPVYVFLGVVIAHTVRMLFFPEGYSYESSGYNVRLLFFICHLYFCVYSVFIIVHYMRNAQDDYNKKRYRTMILFASLPFLAGAFQFFCPMVPFYSMGFMLGGLVMFINGVILTRERLITLENQEQNKRNISLIDALTSEYELVYTLDGVTRNYKRLSITENIFPEECPESGEDFFRDFWNIIKNYAPKEDWDYIYKNIGPLKIFKIMKTQNTYNFNVSMTVENKPYYLRAKFVRLNSEEDDLSILVGIRNVTSEMELENFHKKELDDAYRKQEIYLNKSKEYMEVMEGIAQVYMTMHLIDLEEDSFITVKSQPSIEKFINDEKGASVQIANVMRGISCKESRDSLLKFVDFETLKERMKDKISVSHEFLAGEKGKEQWYKSEFIRIKDNDRGEPGKIIHVVSAIDEEKRKEFDYQLKLKNALDNTNEVYGEILKLQNNGVVAMDMDNHIVIYNNAALQMLNCTEKDVEDRDFLEILSGLEFDDKDKFVDEFIKAKNEGGIIDYEFATDYGNDMKIYIMANSRCVTLAKGDKLVITGMTNITHNKAMENELVYLSETDALCGIRNRGSGEKKTEYLIKSGTDGMLCIIDVNKFKSINDVYGHTVGDKALIAVSECLTRCFRDKDIVMRLGGDEFAVFAPGVVTRDVAGRCFKRLIEAIDAVKLKDMDNKRITISLGAVFTTKAKTKKFEDFYRMADKAMYRCKEQEGSNFAFYED